MGVAAHLLGIESSIGIYEAVISMLSCSSLFSVRLLDFTPDFVAKTLAPNKTWSICLANEPALFVRSSFLFLEYQCVTRIRWPRPRTIDNVEKTASFSDEQKSSRSSLLHANRWPSSRGLFDDLLSVAYLSNRCWICFPRAIDFLLVPLTRLEQSCCEDVDRSIYIFAIFYFSRNATTSIFKLV